MDLPVEATGSEEGGVEILEAVRSAHHHDVVAWPESVELDEQLVQRLIVLAIERAGPARHADRVELVDEDDRRRVLTSLFEELSDPGGSEPREHLDERRRAGRVEVRARLGGDRLGDQRLPRAWRAVQQDALRDPRAETLELLTIAQEVDDLLQLGLRLVQSGDVRPRDVRALVLLHLRGFDPRHVLNGLPEEERDDDEKQDRGPRYD